MNRITRGSVAVGMAAAMGASGAAWAQSSVTVYGVADAGLVRESGGAAGSVTNVSSGVASGSRLGFKGKEDLGGGLAAFFQLENGMNLDNGSAAQGGLLFGRQAYVGLSSAAGSVTLGRQYSPYYKVLRDVADPFCIGLAGNAGNIMVTNTRVDNMVQYALPQWHGLTAEVAVGMGEVAGSFERNRAYSAAAYYTQGKLVVAGAWFQRQNALATDQTRNALLTARYHFGVLEATVGYAHNHGLAGAHSDDVVVGAIVPLGAHRFLVSYVRHDDKTRAARDASQWALGYTYTLSKRTDLYAAYGHINNSNGATFKVGNATESGSGNRATNLGIRHVF
ncbi:porin [Pseudoduganella ginsengisoli]|uniref:Porin n=1 Tax=Pseudoduganella ginsengisoli TaxID=1462440 RepID=A0A6L6Q317_9BURK|nr:porin [Pseudoduganella ginsengisoli]MTW03804.1 porin [Pseudoduganella ginsengisoli]